MSKLRKYRGQAIVEMVGTLIIFSFLLAFIANVSVYMYLQHSMATIARQGARAASINKDLSGANSADGIAAVKAEMQSFAQATSSIELADENITVTPPDMADPAGEREVSVAINIDIPTPLNLGGLLEAMGASDASALKTIPINTGAVMRYED